MNKKGQAAMEFLMTYGWAILVVLIAIGALAYFGVLNPGKYLPNSCTISNQFGCQEFKAMATGATVPTLANGMNTTIIVLQNGRGTDVNITNVTLTQVNPTSLAPCFVRRADDVITGLWGNAAAADTSYLLLDGSNVQVKVYCTGTPMAAGSKFKATLTISYWDPQSALGIRQATGSIVTKAE